jgi:hypothetical protein
MDSLLIADVVTLLVLLTASELLFRYGRAARKSSDDAMRSQVATAQASTLGLLALLLGFTLSMAESRFNWRRQFILQEAAAVGTTYLRAEFLPEPTRSESKDLLQSYVDARRAYYGATVAQAPATTERAQQIHVELWSRIRVVAREHLDSDVIALYIESLNQVIDLEAMRDVAITARMPWTIRMLLLFVGLAAVGLSGYATGLHGKRVGVAIWLLPTLIALSFTIIADLDRSRAGLISTGDLPMTRLQQTLRKDLPLPASASRP